MQPAYTPAMSRAAQVLLFALGLALADGVTAQVYKWVDKDGNIRYSDKPPPDDKKAKPVELKPLTSLEAIAPPPESGATERAEAEQEAATGGYRGFRFKRPQPDQTLSNIGTLLSVELDFEPALMPGHQLMVTFNGQDYQARASTVTLTNVFRGTHSISARIVDDQGKVLASTGPITFHVQQHAIIQKLLGPKK